MLLKDKQKLKRNSKVLVLITYGYSHQDIEAGSS